MLERLLSMQHLQLKCLEKSLTKQARVTNLHPASPTLILDVPEQQFHQMPCPP